jgi:putative endonuclease
MTKEKGNALGIHTAGRAFIRTSTHTVVASNARSYNHDEMAYFVYILASRRNGTFYVGVTNDLARRIHEHRACTVQGFTRRHGVARLVYCEIYPAILDAISREKRLKRWNRAWKIQAIDAFNPEWDDLYESLNS